MNWVDRGVSCAIASETPTQGICHMCVGLDCAFALGKDQTHLVSISSPELKLGPLSVVPIVPEQAHWPMRSVLRPSHWALNTIGCYQRPGLPVRRPRLPVEKEHVEVPGSVFSVCSALSGSYVSKAKSSVFSLSLQVILVVRWDCLLVLVS